MFEGHIAQPYENLDVNLIELKSIIDAFMTNDRRALSTIQEKIDGQNITFTFRDGKLLFFSKGPSESMLRTGGDDRNALDKKLASKKDVRTSFLSAYDQINEHFQSYLEYFENGRVLIEASLLDRRIRNLIPYNDDYIVLINSTAGSESLRQFHNKSESSKNYKIVIVPTFDHNASFDHSKFLHTRNSLENLWYLCGKSPTAPVKEIMKKMTEVYLSNKGFPSAMNAGLSERIIHENKSQFSLKEIDARYGKNMANKVKQLDENRRLILQEIFLPLEAIFADFSSILFDHLNFSLSSNDIHDGENIRHFVKKVNVAFANKALKGTPQQLQQVEICLKRIGNVDNYRKPVEGIVFTFGGKTYKLTGLFASINKLHGLFKYGSNPIQFRESL